MAKRTFFGWTEGIKKETGKPYKLICLGVQSDRWHGYEIEIKYVPQEVRIPDCKPGALLYVEYDGNGYIDRDCEMKVLNG